jgi:hypothetical protein
LSKEERRLTKAKVVCSVLRAFRDKETKKRYIPGDKYVSSDPERIAELQHAEFLSEIETILAEGKEDEKPGIPEMPEAELKPEEQKEEEAKERKPDTPDESPETEAKPAEVEPKKDKPKKSVKPEDPETSETGVKPDADNAG